MSIINKWEQTGSIVAVSITSLNADGKLFLRLTS